MAVQIQSPLFVSALLALVHLLPLGAHITPPTATNDLLNTIFFRQTDLTPGHSLPLFFQLRNPDKAPKFLLKSISDSLPFSLSLLPSLLRTLRIPPSSPQADSMSQTLSHCLQPPVPGESKFCATSLESLLDSIRGQFGSGSRPGLLTTDPRAGLDRLQSFTVVAEPKLIVPEYSYSMACHPMPFPYAVFYCHGQMGSNRLYEVEMETERDGALLRVRVLGMCHLDTSNWDPDTLALRVLGIRPGEEPVCHVFPLDTLVWVPKRNSTGGVLETVV